MDISAVGAAALAQEKEDLRLREKAIEFEAVYLGTLVTEMLESATPSDMNGGIGEDMFKSVMGSAVAEELARSGGVGLAASVEAQMKAYVK